MLWQRTNQTDQTIWVAVGADGKRIKDEEGKYVIRDDALPGAAYQHAWSATLDKTATPVELPDGWPFQSKEAFIVRFCFTDKAKAEWHFLDAWKRRRTTFLTHLGCGDQWPPVEPTLPVTCPTCGVLPGNRSLYASWYTERDPEGKRLPDPKDDMVLELAVDAGSPVIVSFNTRDFVGVHRFGIRMVTPREYLQEIGDVP